MYINPPILLNEFLNKIMKNIKFVWFFTTALLLYSCSTKYEIPSLKPNSYYATQINQQYYIILVDTIIKIQGTKKTKAVNPSPEISNPKTHTSHLRSTAYLIDNNEFTKPQLFHVVYKKRKTSAFLNEKNASFSNSFIIYEPPAITEFPKRFLDSLFTVTIHKDVVYAQAEGFWDHSFKTEDEIGRALLAGLPATFRGKKLSLKMDIYTPQHAGNIQRPLLVMIHGGAFYVGDKSQKAIVEACQYFTSLGYTTASINYRLGFLPTQTSIERAAYKALQDAHAALRFLVFNANKYKIEPDYIFVGGSSAGGITALNLAFMQNQNRPESSYKSFINNDLGNIESVGKHNNLTFQIKSIVNLWGAIEDLNLLKNNNVSVLSYHSIGDPVVPYYYDYPMQSIVKKLAPTFFSKMYGSKPVHNKLNELGYRQKLVTEFAETHNLWENKEGVNDTFYKIINDMKLFFYEDLVPEPVALEYDAAQGQRYYISNTKNVDLITWQCDGGFIINNNESEIFVIWRADAVEKKLITSGIYRNGAAFKTELKK